MLPERIWPAGWRWPAPALGQGQACLPAWASSLYRIQSAWTSRLYLIPSWDEELTCSRYVSELQFFTFFKYRFVIKIVYQLHLTLWSHELQHTRLPCLSLSLGVCSNSCPLSQWCYLPSHPLSPPIFPSIMVLSMIINNAIKTRTTVSCSLDQ